MNKKEKFYEYEEYHGQPCAVALVIIGAFLATVIGGTYLIMALLNLIIKG